MTDLHYLSAAEVLQAFNARELSPVEVFDAVSARADEVEPRINALLERNVQASRAEAVAAQERYANGSTRGVLDGLPIVAKEAHPIAGRPMLLGSVLTEGFVCPATHPVIERAVDAGAIVHARTTTPEFSCSGFTHSALWGETRNPWNLEYSPGGSSGGSAAALASGTAYLATGSDIGGSIRIPASFCGVVGFKSTYGRVPTLPPRNLDTYVVHGALARTVADTALLHNVISGQHRVDHVSLPKVEIPTELGDVRGLKIALALTLGDFRVEDEVVANTRDFAEALRAAGAIVEQVEIPIRLADVQSAALAHFGGQMAPTLTSLVSKDDERLTPYTRMFLDWSIAEFERVGDYGGAQLEGQIHQTIAAGFAEYDALICPTIGALGFLSGEDYVDTRLTVAGRELDLYIMGCLTLPFNIASRYPVLSVPSGRASNGVPTGVQVVARPYDDVTAFHVGAAAERELGLTVAADWRPNL